MKFKSGSSLFISVHLPSGFRTFFVVLILWMITAVGTFAQCAMCKANIANAENAAEVSQRMNSAVLILLIPTFLIIGGIVRLVFKYRDHHHKIEMSIRSDERHD